MPASLATLVVRLAQGGHVQLSPAEVAIVHGLAEENALLRAVIDSMEDAVVCVDIDAHPVLTNRAGAGLHAPDGPPEHRPLARALRGERVRQQEVTVRGAHFSVNASAVRDERGAVRCAVAVSRDVTAAHTAAALIEAQQKKLADLAIIDELTGLKNRRGFVELAGSHVKLAQRNRRPCTLFYCDLDGLKQINDKLGHAAGDRAIVDLGRALTATFRTTDIVARLGGDELVVLATECGAAAVDGILQRFEGALAAREGWAVPLRASVGFVVHEPRGDSGVTIDDLLARADTAMYARKRARKAGGAAARAIEHVLTTAHDAAVA